MSEVPLYSYPRPNTAPTFRGRATSASSTHGVLVFTLNTVELISTLGALPPPKVGPSITRSSHARLARQPFPEIRPTPASCAPRPEASHPIHEAFEANVVQF